MNIAEILVNAQFFNFKNQRLMDDNLTQSVTKLFDLLINRQINYLLVGGIALLNYIQGRNTEDIDLILSLADLDELPELDIQEQNNDFAAAVFQNLAVDILLTQNKLFNLVQKNYVTSFDFQGRIIFCSTVEGLVLLKLYALPSLYRQANFSKVALYETDLMMLLQEYPTDMPPLFTELKKHLPPGDLASLQDIYREIDEKIQRFSTRF